MEFIQFLSTKEGLALLQFMTSSGAMGIGAGIFGWAWRMERRVTIIEARCPKNIDPKDCYK